MRLIPILLVTYIAWSMAQAQIHYWIDEKGIQHYSCDPPPDKNAVKDYQVFATFDNVPKRVKATNNRSTPNNEYPDIIMYSTSWCGVCKQAKAWLNSKNVPYNDYDVEKIPKARAEYDRLGGSGVPLIRVGDHMLSGWSEAWMKKQLGME